MGQLVTYIRQKKGKPFLLKHDDFSKAAACVVTSIILGKQYSFDDEELSRFLQEINKIYEQITDVSI